MSNATISPPFTVYILNLKVKPPTFNRKEISNLSEVEGEIVFSDENPTFNEVKDGGLVSNKSQQIFADVINSLGFKVDTPESYEAMIKYGYAKHIINSGDWFNYFTLLNQKEPNHLIQWISDMCSKTCTLDYSPPQKGIVITASTSELIWLYPNINEPRSKIQSAKEKIKSWACNGTYQHRFYINQPAFLDDLKDVNTNTTMPLLRIYAQLRYTEDTQLFESLIYAAHKGNENLATTSKSLNDHYQQYRQNPSDVMANLLFSKTVDAQFEAKAKNQNEILEQAAFWEREGNGHKQGLRCLEKYNIPIMFVLIILIILIYIWCDPIHKLPSNVQIILAMIIPYTALAITSKIRHARKMSEQSYILKTRLTLWAISFDLSSEQREHFISTYKDILSKDVNADVKDEILSELIKKIEVPKSK